MLGGSGYDLGCINKGASFHDVGGRIETGPIVSIGPVVLCCIG